MPTESLIPRFLHRNDDSKIQLVVPADDPPGAPKETLFSVEATAEDYSEDELRLLGIKPLGATARVDPPKQLRWMHLSNNGMEFGLFLKRAFEAYGIDQQTQTTISKFFDRFAALCEQLAFRGGRFRPVPASTKIKLPGSEENVMVNFIAVPYFLLQEAQSPPKRTTSRTKVHWVQPLVQSAYHLDSSMARENQQAVRRLYSHVKEVIHVPQLWLLNIGDKFLATRSPTPLYDSQASSIITRTVGRDPFPPTIRVTTASGFVFCLERGKCGVWFEFLYRVQSVMSAVREACIDTRNWVYKLETDGSPVDARCWRLLLQQHPDSKPLPILAAPREPNSEPAQADEFVPEMRYPAEVSEILKKLDEKVRAHHQRRMAALRANDGFMRRESTDHPYQYIDPFYWPPESVLKAAAAQYKREQEQGQSQTPSAQSQSQTKEDEGAQKKQQPFFKWTVGKPFRDKELDDPTPTQRMKSLVAHTHRDILFLSGQRITRLYNELRLETKPSVLKLIDALRTKHKVSAYILDPVLDFVRYISEILDEFIDRGYECIVKGKVWAAVHAIVETFQYGLVDTLVTFQTDVLAIPLEPALRQIRSIREGLAGVDNPSIPRSLVDAFVQLVVLLVDLAAEASRLVASIEQQLKTEAMNSSLSPQEPTQDPAVDPNSPRKEPDAPSKPDKTDPDETDSYADSDSDSDDDSDNDSDTEDRKGRGDINITTLPYRTDFAIDQFFRQLADAQDECCATFRSDDERVSAPGLGTIIALALESVLRGHSKCREMPALDIGEIYATYTTSLQLEARNRPSKNLLLDINLLREELETIMRNIDQQLKLITDFRTDTAGFRPDEDDEDLYMDETENINFDLLYSPVFEDGVLSDASARAVLQEIHADLQERKDVFTELSKRADTLERQIVQRVDIIQEDHGKAILVFTIVSTIFLPLSFVSSYLGMNTVDIRDMERDQGLFWQAAVPLTVVVVALVLLGAYNAGRILSWVSRGRL